jgi:hypothetical protein
MNHILHNISLIILGLGIILLTVYVTKATSNGFKTTDVVLMEQQELEKRRRGFKPDESIYDTRPSKVYKKMFSDPSNWFGYADFDENEIKEKLYVKSA